MAQTVWAQGCALCESRAVLAAATLQGSTAASLRAQLREAQLESYAYPSGEKVAANIDKFHGRDVAYHA